MAKKLLLADDSITIQKVVAITFANEDYQITSVDNGEDAVNKARELRPDVILADVVMPRRNGYEVCEAIKGDPSLRHIPVLLLAGTFEAFDEGRARAASADGHIQKPFESQALIDRVNLLCGKASVAGSAMGSGMPAAPIQMTAAAPAAAARPGMPPPPGQPMAARPPTPGMPPPPGARPPTPGMPPPGPARPGMPPAPGMARPPTPGMPPAPGQPMARPPTPGMPPAPRPPGPPAPAMPAPGQPMARPPTPGMPPAPGMQARPPTPGMPPPAGMPRPGMPPAPGQPVRPAGPGMPPPPGTRLPTPGMPPPPGAALPKAPLPPPANPVAQQPRPQKDPFGLGVMPTTAPAIPDMEAEKRKLDAEIAAATAPAATNGFDDHDIDMDEPKVVEARQTPVVVPPAPEPIALKPLPSKPMETPSHTPASADGGEALLRDALSKATKEVIEKIAWEVVPQLAETIIREELDRLVKERQAKA